MTVITIGETIAGLAKSEDSSSDACLPPVLQDRTRTPSQTGGGVGTGGVGARITQTGDHPDFPVSNLRKLTNRPDVVATCTAVASKLSASSFNGKPIFSFLS